MEQNEIIRRLSRGEGFDIVAPDRRPERIDTHISTIFLIGDHAYKLKRALTTTYLDYATLEDRQRFCRTELEINRRTAPNIYLDVVPVRLAPDNRLVIGEGDGEPVEWLVHMRRFDQDGIFDRLAGAGRLTPGLLTELADAIATFHQDAKVVRGAGAAARISFVIDENTKELEEKGAGIVDLSLAETFERSCRTEFDRLSSLIERRGMQGYVRHCHGDLHLRNICLVDGKPTLFDAIEFSDRISHIDVLFDLAFLSMDLAHRGLIAEANLVFNRYLYRTGDIGDLSVFPLYQALRAGIRAHVSAMAAATRENTDEAGDLRQEADSYLRLGQQQFGSVSPKLVAIGGLSGTGKSTIARAIAPYLGRAPGALVLSSDLIRKRLLGVDPLTRLTDTAYTPEIDRAVYDELGDAALRIVAGGYTAVLDATFMASARREALETVARNAGVPLEGFWLEAGADALRERVSRRGGDPSDATVSVLEGQLARDIGEIGWRRIDAARPPGKIGAAIRRALESRATIDLN